MKVSFILVEYHSLIDVKEFLESINLFLDMNYEIILSSNSLYDMSKQESLKRDFKGVTWIFNEKNGGFAYAMNKGIEKATGDLITIINPDVRIISGLKEMISFIEDDEKIGIIAPKIVDEAYNIQDSFRSYVTPYNFFKRFFIRILKKRDVIMDYFELNQIQPVDWVIGAFIMMRRETFFKVGYLDEAYFLYCEDMDWCTRTRQAGYQVIYYPKAIINYKGTRSARSSFKYMIIFFKSLLRFWSKFGIKNSLKGNE